MDDGDGLSLCNIEILVGSLPLAFEADYVDLMAITFHRRPLNFQKRNNR